MIDIKNGDRAFEDRPEFVDPATGGIINLPLDTKLGQKLLLPLARCAALQRLRHICQLSFAHYAFGGKYSRFTHSLQAAAEASDEMDILKDRMSRRFPGTFDQRLADAVVTALLLHDVGHAPYSHTFENVMNNLGENFHHEEWTRRIITEDGDIQEIFARFMRSNPEYGSAFTRRYGCTFPDMVANLIDGPVAPELTIYKSFVSGARDCDRTVYLFTDRIVTGAYRHSFKLTRLNRHIGT